MTNPLLAQFVAEATDLMAEVDEGLLRLERDPHDADLVNAVFRAAHTFKGSSGLFDLPELTRLTHAAEDLLDSVRSGALSLDGDMVDDLLAAFDAVRSWIPAIEATGKAPAGAAETGNAIAVRLRAPLGGPAEPAAASAAPAASATASTTVARAPEWVRIFGEDELRELASWMERSGATLRAVDYAPDAECFFRGEDPLLTLRGLPALHAVRITVAEPLPAIEDLDEYSCTMRLRALTRAGAGEAGYVFRYVDDQVEIVDLDAQSLTRLLDGRPDEGDGGSGGGADGGSDQGAAEAAGADAERERPAALVALLDSQRRLLATSPTPAGVRSAAAVVRRVLAALGDGVPAAALAADGPALLAWLTERAASTPSPAAVPAPRSSGENSDDHTADHAADHPTHPVEERRADARADDPGQGSRVLKVEQGKVDRLLDLVGELVVAKNALPYVADSAEEDGHRALARRIKDEYAVVSRVSEELQQAVMDVRMLPVGTAFARVPRLVRDLSRKLGKSVRLVQEGEDVAADKDVIEMLAEPLVHLVRNSLDHGIEAPADREAAGKNAEATLTLRAVQDGDAVAVEVGDDGRGIDTDRVRRKAYERGVIDEQALETLTEEQAAELIFAPGFSTAETISDVSGRGVGMDAVRSSIERLGGSVSLSSTRGVGMRVRLRLPLTMAVSRVLLITAGGQRFGVPLDEVVETVRVSRADLTRVAGHEVLVLREDVVPLVNLAGMLDLDAAGPAAGPSASASTSAAAAEVNVLVVRTPTGPLGVVVDRFHANTDVILKPLEGVIAGTAAYSGTALLGDGLVLLVLDIKELNARATAAR